MAYTLRPYQNQAMTRTHELMRKGATSILEVAPTGAGKTVIAAAMIEEFLRMGARILFVAHRDELIGQCCAKLRENGLSYGVIKAGRDSGDLYAKVHVASVQTFVARIKFMRSDYSLIIFDEAHHSVAPSFMKIVAHCTHDGRQPIVIGLTATPFRTDGKGLGELYKEMVEVTSTAKLINEGFLVPPRIYRAEAPRELHRLKTQNGDYREDDLEEVMNKPRLLGHAVNEFLRITGGLPMRTLGFYVNRAHAKAGCEAFQAAGVPAEYVDEETPAGERRDILERLHSGKTLMICNCGVFTEGFDEPRIEIIQGLRPSKSLNLVIQMVGRGARLCPELYKTHFILLDHCGWTDEHGYFTDPVIADLSHGLAKERPRPVVTCPLCGAQLASRPRLCPSCGAPLAQAGEQEDTIGLGDESVQLTEDQDFFSGFQRRTEPSRPAAVYVPARPSMYRVARRVRGR